MQLISRHSRRAFTLIELVMASGIIAILLVVVQSVIVLASHAVPGVQSRSTSLTSATGILADFDADLAFATAITSRTPTSITFTVPDRNSDGNPETITWSWSGTPGTPLYRTFNSNAPVAVHSSVQSFSLAYNTRIALGTPPTSTSAETLLASNLLVTGIGAKPVHSRTVDKNNAWGQYILPALPSNATTYAITRVQVMLQYGGGNATQAVQLLSADTSDLPTAAIIDSAPLQFSLLSTTLTWTQFNFTQATNLPVTKGFALAIVQSGGNANAGYVNSQDVAPGVNAGILSSINAGSTWTYAPNNSNLLYYVYGTICTPGTPPTLYYLTGCRATLLLTSDVHGTARHTVRILNEPQVTGP